MSELIGFKRHFTPYVVDGEAVYLVSERGVSVVDGRLAQALAPLLDGTRTAEQIGAALDGVVPVDKLRAGVDKLRAGGWVTAADPATDRPGAAFFEMAGQDGDTAMTALRTATVRVEVHGELDPAPFLAALAAAGVTVDQDAEFTVALTDDYLHPGLAARNRQALADGRPWLLARPVGSIVWVGPVFSPDAEDTDGSGCWECLAHRLSANRQSLSYLQHRLGQDQPISTAGAHLPATLALGTQLAALETAKWLAGARPPQPAVTTLDTVLLESEKHVLVRRPQCPSCGDDAMVSRRQLAPVAFESRPKAFTADGGHRSASPEDMLEKYRPQLSPVTGVVTTLVPAARTPTGLRVYVSGQNLSRQSGDLKQLRTGLRSVSCGKGRTDVQARASALGEAMERFSGVFQGDEARRTATFAELGDAAIHPERTLLYSAKQYAERDRWNVKQSMFNIVPVPFRADDPIEWSPAWSLTEQRHRWLPTQAMYYGYRHSGRFYAAGDSNGCAAGTSFEDAVLQGFLELVERDAVALWWYNRVQRPAVDLDAFGDPYVDQLREVYRGLRREIWALDLTADFGIPVVGAFSRRVDAGNGTNEDVLIAFGAHLDPHIALTRALTEMNQFLGPVAGDEHGRVSYAGADPEQKAWWTTATVANQPYLLPDPHAPRSTPASWLPLAGPDLADDLALVQKIVEDRGMEFLVADQTRPDVGLPVARVIVPGMRHFWARFAPGRLYDVPVRLGWLDTPTPESELNPIPIFI
ncbi:TOMM precursor leader peptide-binding protein [Kitasatospora sp. YST-16]|uniref:TOMM precursor leader peptide-binding protein n=1 Tax=Kitasatospora sp. YST-16 TaxID=2998080 RepID=UPI0022848772|nr:TOMM precursor leader peptide-binding protein [Kitasatospora sp. YST-16]WAL73463.1 TOMM precursor leader peptide-binding protein [Kitasatospora sp. YST-16]WNW39514.1 TOMM precursor leader peptide-binding protein [Streptomyces sp. Li-HN-5-13]